MSETQTIQQVGEKLGFAADATNKIMADIKANTDKLNSCTGHAFTIPFDRLTKKEISVPNLGCRWRCSNCGGEVDATARIWYNKGVEHAISSFLKRQEIK